MRVGVNLLWLTPGVVGGSEEYTVRTLLALAEADPADLELTLFAQGELARAHPQLAAAFPTVAVELDGRRRPLRVAAESTWLAAQARRRRIELLHHAGGVAPPGCRTPYALTIHDLQPLERPEQFSAAKRRYLAALLPRSARRARLVLTPSAHAAAAVTRLLGVPAARTAVVPHGVAAAPGPDAGGLGPAAAAAVAARRGIARRFFVYPAITYPHKNHAVLLDALARLEGGEGRGVDLVFTGRADRAEAALAARAAELGLAGRVHRLGRIPRPELDALISGAVALLFPSTYEGFGAPALEAMALGCPVVASAGGALAEVVGDAGLLVDPHDPGAWAEAMGGLLASPERRRTLAAAGARRAGEFSAEASARALAAAYRRALMEPTPP